MTHPSHQSEIAKLNRVSGQIEGIKKMIEETRHCPDILTQIRAARAALRTIETNILERHMQFCVTQALEGGKPGSAEKTISELKDILKRFD